MVARSLFAALFVLMVPSAVGAADGFNAAWRAGSKGPVSFWIYEKDGTCETRKDPTFAIGTRDSSPGASIALTPKDLHFCLLFTAADKSENCAAGSFEATYDATQDAYRGRYRLSFNDGRERSGEFRAQRCAQRK